MLKDCSFEHLGVDDDQIHEMTMWPSACMAFVSSYPMPRYASIIRCSTLLSLLSVGDKSQEEMQWLEKVVRIVT